MKIKNIEGLSAADLLEEVEKGGRFIYYAYTISFVIVTFKRVSGVYLVRAGENVATKGLPFTLLTGFFGWWGLPFGPKYSWQAIRTNMNGGKDVTEEVLSTVEGFILFEEAQRRKKAS